MNIPEHKIPDFHYSFRTHSFRIFTILPGTAFFGKLLGFNKQHPHNPINHFCFIISQLKIPLNDICPRKVCIPPLFPTQTSQNIALKIIENLNEEGYFEGDIENMAKECRCSSEEIEKIRKRFAYLDPPGIGAKNLKESFYFQLDNMDIKSEIFELCSKILEDLEHHIHFKDECLYKEAMRVIQSFKNPPALYFYEKARIWA